jgi:Mn2+/Fe2+ NRAMP family transporter
MPSNKKQGFSNLLFIIGPGLLVAATGVGAGDLAGGAFAGSKLGVAVLWAVLLGAFFKFVVTEGLARWQLATGETLLEGAVRRLGRGVQYFFLIYLLIWSYYVGSALISACGVAGSALVPVFSPETGKIIFGIFHSIAGLVLILLGNYRLFEKIMSVCIGLMFITVLTTAIRIGPAWGEIVKGLFIPSIPAYITETGSNQGPVWTLALMGGVGGTLTILCYGYWIREKGRSGKSDLKICRIDLMVAYIITALFGIAMVIIASRTDLDKQSSARLVIVLADRLQLHLGETGRLLFLTGAWAAIFSSLLGVWQSVPYLFADFWSLCRQSQIRPPSDVQPVKVDVRSPPYRMYLTGLSIIPMIGLRTQFVFIQKINAVFGSLMIPMLALVLLVLNGKTKWIGTSFKNRPVTTAVLILILIVFLFIGGPQLLTIFK